MEKNKMQASGSSKISFGSEVSTDHHDNPANSVKQALDNSASSVFRELRDQYSKKNNYQTESSLSASRKSSSFNPDPTLERFLQQSLPKRPSPPRAVDRSPIPEIQDAGRSLSNNQHINWNSLKYSAIQEAATAKAKERKEKEKEKEAAIFPPPSTYYYHREEDDGNDLAMLKQLSLKERVEEMTRRGLSPEEMVEKGFRENLTEIIGNDNKDRATDESEIARRRLKGKFIELSSSEGSEDEAEVQQLKSKDNEIEEEEPQLWTDQKTDYDHTTANDGDDGNEFVDNKYSISEEDEQQQGENTVHDSNNNNDNDDQNSNIGLASKVRNFASSVICKIKSSIFQRGHSERDNEQNMDNKDDGDGNQIHPPSYSLYHHMMKEKNTPNE
jgi:hypothetical protein